MPSDDNSQLNICMWIDVHFYYYFKLLSDFSLLLLQDKIIGNVQGLEKANKVIASGSIGQHNKDDSPSLEKNENIQESDHEMMDIAISTNDNDLTSENFQITDEVLEANVEDVVSSICYVELYRYFQKQPKINDMVLQLLISNYMYAYTIIH